MMNPWKEIRLSDYENHIRLDSVDIERLEFGIIPKQYRRPGYGMKNEVDMDDVATAQEG